MTNICPVFFRFVSALRYVLVVAALLLTGIGPQRELRIGLPVAPNTLDPIVSTQYIENYIEEALFSGLTVVDDHGDLQPDLAQVVPTKANGGISADGKTLTYHLRHNVRWQDGVPFSARDVVFTFEKIRDPRVPFALGSWFSIIKDLRAPDPYTVVITLHAASADATWQLFVNGEFGMIIPEHLLRNVTDLRSAPFGGMPIGTGPYRVERWDRGYGLELRANPAYFRGAPHIDHIHIAFVPDQNTLALQKRTGELDFVQSLPLTQRSAFVNSSALTVRLVPAYYLDYVVANIHAAPFDDVRVRRAFGLAIDRRSLADNTYHGAAVVADAFVPPWSRFYSPPTGTQNDLAAARRLLDAAGWHAGRDGMRSKSGVPLSFALTTVAGQTVLVNAAIALQATWRAIGGNVELRPVQSTVIFAPGGILQSGNFALAFVNYGELARPDIADNIATTALPPRGSNYSRFSDPDVDRWLSESRAADNVALRRRIVAKMQDRLTQQAPMIPVLWERFLYAWSGDLRGVKPETVNSDLWNVYTWQWK